MMRACPKLSLKLGTYKLTGLCDIPAIAAGIDYYICSMAVLPIDAENLPNQGAGESRLP